MTDHKDVEHDSMAPSIQSSNQSEAPELEPVLTNNARPAAFKSTVQEVLFVLTATMAIAMTSFLGGSVTVTSSFIGKSLGGDTAGIVWISASSSLSSGAFLLFFGRVADLFGRKSLFVGSLFLFSIFCLAAGFAQDAITLDILNGVLGLFSASAVPPAVGILGVVYEKPSRRKNAAFACFSAGNPMGFVFGTIFGGVAAQLFGWRASFWLLAIIFIVFTVVAIFTVPKDFTKKEPLNWTTLKGFDFVGSLLTIAGIGMFSAALTLGDSASDGWKTPYVLALLIVGFLLIVAFIFWEMYVENPLMPMRIWKDKNFSVVLSILSLGMLSFMPAEFFASLYFQNIYKYGALEVALHLLPMAIMGTLVNVFAGWGLNKISNKLLVWIGTACYGIAMLLQAVNRASDNYWSFFFPALVLVVVGADLQFNVANMYVMSSMEPHMQSTAGGIFQTITRLATTIGMGIATAVFSSVQKNPTLSSYWDVETQPYAATFWFSFAAILVSLCLIPFLSIGTQGGKAKKVESTIDEKSAAPTDEKEDLPAEMIIVQPLPIGLSLQKTRSAS